MDNKNCPFCTCPSDRIVAENVFAFAIRDGYPVSPGHTLIIPRRHVGSYFDTVEDERTAMLALMDKEKAKIESELGPHGYNIGINDGHAAGQTVMHLHIHIIPRYLGDLPDPRGGVRWIIPHKADYWSKE